MAWIASGLCSLLAACQPASAPPVGQRTMMAATAVNLRAAELVDTIGVNTHISWQDSGSAYANQTTIKDAIAYLGVHYVRDGVPYEGWTLPFYQQLFAAGVKFDLIVSADDFNSTGDFMASLNHASALATASPGSVASIEGLNEINLWPVTYKGQSTGTNLAVGHDVQALLYQQAQSLAALKGIPVLNLTVGGLTSQQASVLGDMSAIADYGVWHVYFGNGDQPNANIVSGVQGAKLLDPTEPVQITESNYYTAVDAMEWGGGGVTQPIAARLVLNLLMDAARAGVARTFLYELLENNLSPSTTVEGSFGLFTKDGQPKASATAIHNLTAILADPAASAATFTPTPLEVSVSGLPDGEKQLLLQKASGHHQLVLWAEPDIWDQAIRQPISAPSVPVTITLGQPASAIEVYDPIVGTSATSSVQNAAAITVQVTDHPLIIDVAGSPSPQPGQDSGGPTPGSEGSGPTPGAEGGKVPSVDSGGGGGGGGGPGGKDAASGAAASSQLGGSCAVGAASPDVTLGFALGLLLLLARRRR